MCGLHARELLPTEVCLEYVKRYYGEMGMRVDVVMVANEMRWRVLAGDYTIRKDKTGMDGK